MSRQLAPASLCFFAGSFLTLAQTLHAENLTIADFAPPNTLLIAGSDNTKALWEAFDRTGLRAIWDDREFKTWFDLQSKETLEQLAGDLEALGLTTDDLERPMGATGLAAWIEEGAKDANEDAPEPPPAVIIIADYLDRAEHVHEKIVSAFERAEKLDKLTLTDREHDGVTVYTYSFIEDLAEGEEGEMDALEFADTPLEYQEMHYARAGSILLLSSSPDSIDAAIDRVKGEARVAGVSDAPGFAEARARNKDAHAYAIVLGASGTSMIKSAIERAPADEMEFSGLIMPVLDVLGVTEISSISMGLRFDTDDAQVEQTYALLTPKKEGLLALLDAPETAFEPPAFVSAAAASVTLLQFNFAGVIPLANQVIAKLPDEMQATAGQQIQAISMLAGPILANLGPEVCFVNEIKRPLTLDSQQQVVAIKMRNAEALQQSLAGFLPMTGFTSKDFQGNQIWSGQEGGPIPPISLGIGFGWVFIGPNAGVEDLMRQAGAADNPKLASEPNFLAASRLVAKNGLDYAYFDIDASLDWAEWSFANFDLNLQRQAEQMFGDQPPADDEERQWRQQAIDEMRRNTPSWMKNPPPMAPFRKNLGDSITEFRAIPEGFVGRTLTLRAAKP